MVPASLTRLRQRIGWELTRRARWRLSKSYIAGSGVEIGALHEPLRLPPAASVRYVDRLPLSELLHHYPELSSAALVPPDIIDDAETLQAFPADSEDFLISCHVLEHCENPIRALQSWLRVLRPGGILFLAVPDRRFTFDSRRPPTPLSHVVQDYTEGPASSRSAHYLEWVSCIETGAAAPRERARELEEARYSIHFHVWDYAGFSELLRHCIVDLRFPARLLVLRRNRAENLAILQKTTARLQPH